MTYTPERCEVHRKILSWFLSPAGVAAAMPDPGKRPTLSLLGGRPCTGKEWFAGRRYDPERAVVLNAEKVDLMLPEYQGWNAAQVRRESNDIINSISDAARILGCNLVLDVTLKNADAALRRIAQFRNAGYRLELHYMFLPKQEAAKRAVQRYLGKDGKRGRYITVPAVLANTTNEQTSDALKKWCDCWSFYDNNVPYGHEPIFVSGKDDFGQVSLIGEPFPLPGDPPQTPITSRTLDPNKNPDDFDEYDFNDQDPCGKSYFDSILRGSVRKMLARRGAAAQRTAAGTDNRSAIALH